MSSRPAIDWTAIAARASRQASAAHVARLARHLAGLGLDDIPPHLDDVALAFAAADSDAAAQAELHRRLVEVARGKLSAAGYAAHVIDDTIGELALTLFGDPDRPSALLGYRGRASLTAWLRTLVARTALHLVDRYRREVGTGGSDDALIEQLATTNLPRELARAELRTTVRQAFLSVFGRLSLFDRELLRDVVLRGSTVDDIARHHEVHRATAARWIMRIRATIDRDVRDELGRGLVATPSEVESILDSVRSNLELSVEHMLAP